MRRLFLAAILLVIAQVGRAEEGYMSIDPRDICENGYGCYDQLCSTNNVCSANYTKGIRPRASDTNRLKSEELNFFAPGSEPSSYEEDHFIPLELCGSPGFRKENGKWVQDAGAANLWPQPWPEARKKDVMETKLHRRVCKGEITMQQARDILRQNWSQTVPQ